MAENCLVGISNLSSGLPKQNESFYDGSAVYNSPSDVFSLEALLDEDPFCLADTPSPCSSNNNNWFLLLKNKIINTDKLIQRYQGKSRQVKELQTSLTGLKKELKLLHKENNNNQSMVAELQKKFEETKDVNEEQEMYIGQLKARVEEMEVSRSNDLRPIVTLLRKERKQLISERDSLKRENKISNRRLRLLLKEVPHPQKEVRQRCKKDKVKNKLVIELEEELNRIGTGSDDNVEATGSDDNVEVTGSDDNAEATDDTETVRNRKRHNIEIEHDNNKRIRLEEHPVMSMPNLDLEHYDDGISFHDDELSIHDDGASNHDNIVSIHDDDVSSHDDGVSSHDDRVSSHDDGVSIHDDGVSIHDDGVGIHDDGVGIHDDGVSSHNDGVSIHDNGVSIHDDGVSIHDDGVSSHDDGVSSHDDGVSSHDDGVSIHDDGVSSHDDGVSIHDDGVSIHDDSVSSHDGGVSSHDGGVSSHDGGVSNHADGVCIHNNNVSVHGNGINSCDDSVSIHDDGACIHDDGASIHDDETSIYDDCASNHNENVCFQDEDVSSHDDYVSNHDNGISRYEDLTLPVSLMKSDNNEDNSVVSIHDDDVCNHNNDTSNIHTHDENALDNNANIGGVHDNSVTCDDLELNDCYRMITSLRDRFGHKHSLTTLSPLTPLPPSPPASPIPSFEFFPYSPITPLPPSPLTPNSPCCASEQVTLDSSQTRTDNYEDCSSPNNLMIVDNDCRPDDSDRHDNHHDHSHDDHRDYSHDDHGCHLPNPSNDVNFEEGELVESIVLSVGYSNLLSADGATGQWMKDAIPSRSSSPIIDNMSEFPTMLIPKNPACEPHPPNEACPPINLTCEPQPSDNPTCKPHLPTHITPTCEPHPPNRQFCQAQQSLKESFQFPMPLPPWLAEAILQSQDDNLIPTNIKGKNKVKIPGINRPKGQRVADYLDKCIYVTIAGKMTVSKCVRIFANRSNVDNPLSICGALTKMIKTKYFPPFDSVMKLCWSRCAGVVGGIVDPLNPNYVPPLPLQEAIIIALLLNTHQLRSDMPSLLYDVLQKLKDSILSTDINFHSRCVYCRLYCSVCRALSDLDQAQFLVCEILLQSTAINTLPLVVAMVSMWPKAFSRNAFGPPLLVNGVLNTKGLEFQPLSFAIETVMSVLAHATNTSEQCKGPLSNARILCRWEIVPLKTIESLVVSFIEILKISTYIKIETPPSVPGSTHPTPRPRPSKHAYAIVMGLRTVAACQGWAWTNDTLIRQHLWPLLQNWNKHPDNTRPETIVCIIRLLGFIGQKGVMVDPNSVSIQQLLKVFTMILQKSSLVESKVTIAIQLAAADALLDLCPTNSNKLILNPLMAWTTQLMKDKDTTSYAIEYSNILSKRQRHRKL